MNEEVKVKLKASLGMDSSEVQQAMHAMQQQLQSKSNVSEVDTLKYVEQHLQRLIGANGSFVDNRKKLLASYREELAIIRQLENELQRKKSIQGSMDKTDLRIAETEVRSRRHFARTMKDVIDVGTSQEQAEREGKGRRGGLGSEALQSGGLVGAAGGKAWAAIVAHPILSVLAATGLTAGYLKGKFDEWSDYSEKLDVEFTNVGRRSGHGAGLRGTLEPGGIGHVTERMRKLGYAGEDVVKMAGAYSIPGAGLSSALGAQAGFARKFGFGENPEMISGMGRRATQLGVAEPQKQVEFWRMMSDAVTTGYKHGIDASESMKSLLSLTEDVAGHTGVVSRDYVAGLSGIQKAFETGLSRFFKGERGAEQVNTIMQGFQNPQGLAQQRFVMNSIMKQFGGKVPGSKDLGFGGVEARSFDQMTDVQKMQVIMQRMPEFLTSKNPKARSLMSGIAKSFGEAAGPGGQQLMFQGAFGMEPAKGLEAQKALHEAAKKIIGEEKASKMGPFDLLSTILDKGAPGAAAEALKGKGIDTDITQVEHARQIQKETTETFSKAVSDATINLRQFSEELKGTATQRLSEMAKGIREAPKGGLDDRTSRAADALRKGINESSIVKKFKKFFGMGDEEGAPKSEGKIHLQSGSGGSMQIEPLKVSGTIDLTGAGEGSISAEMILPLIQQAIEQQASRTRAMSPYRSRQIGTVGA